MHRAEEVGLWDSFIVYFVALENIILLISELLSVGSAEALIHRVKCGLSVKD